MPIQPIRFFGDPVLTTPASPVTDFDKELRTLVADLIETMHEKDRWTKEATEGFTHMKMEQRSVEVLNEGNVAPRWRVW